MIRNRGKPHRRGRRIAATAVATVLFGLATAAPIPAQWSDVAVDAKARGVVSADDFTRPAVLETMLDLSVEHRDDRSLLQAEIRLAWNALGGHAVTFDESCVRFELSGLIGRWSVGWDTVTWSLADLVSAVEFAAPADYRSVAFGVDSVPDLNSFVAGWSIDWPSGVAELVWLPVFVSDRFTEPLVPGVTILPVAMPEPTFANGQVAARIRLFLPWLDLSAVFFDGYDTMPVYELALEPPSTLALEGSFQRFTAIGAQFALPVGAFLLRAESQVDLNREFSRPASLSVSPVTGTEIRWMAGIDWFRSDWTATLEAGAAHRPERAADWEKDANDWQIGVTVSRSWFGGRLDARVTGITDPDSRATYVRPEFSLLLTDAVELRCLAEILWGELIPGVSDTQVYGVTVRYRL